MAINRPRVTYGGEPIPAVDQLLFSMDPLNSRCWPIAANGQPIGGGQQNIKCGITGISGSIHQTSEADLWITHTRNNDLNTFKSFRFNIDNRDLIRYSRDITEDLDSEAGNVYDNWHPTYPYPQYQNTSNANASTDVEGLEASVGVGGYFTLAMWLNLDLIYNNDSNDGGNQGIITFGGQGGGSSNVWSLIHHHGEGNELQFWMHNAHPSKPSVWSNNYYLRMNGDHVERDFQDKWGFLVIQINNTQLEKGGVDPGNYGKGYMHVASEYYKENNDDAAFGLIDAQAISKTMNRKYNSSQQYDYNFMFDPWDGDGCRYLTLGRGVNTDMYVDGSIGQVYYYKKFLSQDERIALFNATRKRYGL